MEISGPYVRVEASSAPINLPGLDWMTYPSIGECKLLEREGADCLFSVTGLSRRRAGLLHYSQKNKPHNSNCM
jgi:hypothetical protein